MNFLDRAAIKREARAFIAPEKKWWSMFLAILPLLVVTNLFNVIYGVKTGMNYANEEYYVSGSGWNLIGSIITILAVPFTVAIGGYFLNHLRGFNPEWKSLYVEGKERYGKYFEVSFVTGIIIWLWSLLFIIPGIVKTYAYSQYKYIIHDNPNLSSQDVRRMSDIMTKGYKGDLFIRDLSFFFWYCLMACTAGVAGIYVIPYYSTVEAMYYENLKNHAIEAGLIAPEAFGIVPAAPAEENQNDAAPFNYSFSGNSAYAAPAAPAVTAAPAQTQIPQAAEPANDPSFVDDSNMEFDPSTLRAGEPEIPETPVIPEERPIVLNGEEYKPEDGNPLD